MLFRSAYRPAWPASEDDRRRSETYAEGSLGVRPAVGVVHVMTKELIPQLAYLPELASSRLGSIHQPASVLLLCTAT